MNDRGLFCDAASTPESYGPPRSPGKRTWPKDALDKLLAENANVEEAIAWLQQHYAEKYNAHLMLVDKSGNSAVVEGVNQEFKAIQREGPFQVITNFLLSAPELGGYPCDRYSQAVEMLQKDPETSIPVFTGILKKVSRVYATTGDGTLHATFYSNIYDLKSGTVYVYYKRNFAQPVVFHLQDELKKGNHTYRLEDLFPGIVDPVAVLKNTVVLKRLDAFKVASLRDILPSYGDQTKLWNELYDYLQKHDIRANGAGFTIYRGSTGQTVDVEVVVPVAELGVSSGRVKFRVMDAVDEMASVLYKGAYQDFPIGYAAIYRWLAENGYKINGPNQEVWIKGDWNEKDPNEWLTEIQIPVNHF